MANMAEAMDRLAAASEAQVKLLQEESRRRTDEERARFDNRPAGRGGPRRLSFGSLLAAPGLAAQAAGQFKATVPGEYWTQVDHDHAQVACPCGHTPDLPHGRPVECRCNRFFVWTGPEVRVAKYDTCGLVD